MAMRTKQELVTAALRGLRVLPDGETPSAEDFDTGEAAYDELHSELADRGLVYWTNTDDVTQEIPLAVFSGLTSILADRIAASYGKPPTQTQDEDGRMVTGYVAGMRRLRQHMSKAPSGEATPFSSY